MAEPRGRNPLHTFVNYTYLISLHLLKRDTYNQLSGADGKVPGSNYRPDSVLIASAGVRETVFSGVTGTEAQVVSRNPLWNEDFYFEGLKIETVIGLNSITRGTNAFKLEFSIIEPNGASLIERLIETSAATDYMDYRSMVFALHVEFVGYDDDGNAKRIPEQTKTIPIKFISMGFKISDRGSEYAISAMPYNHQAFHNSAVSIPKNLNVVASTVAEYFAANSASERVYLDKNDRLVPAIRDAAATGSSVCDSINQNQQELVARNKQRIADKFQIIFADEIGKSKLVLDVNKANKDSTNMGSVKQRNIQSTLDYGAYTYQINAGTTLIDEINRVVRNSAFFLNQLAAPMTSSSQDSSAMTRTGSGPLRWWRIIPKVKLLEYDTLRKVYATEVTYLVKVYEIYGSQYPGTPSAPPPITRRYEYLYTGQNNDILSFDINFDMAYYIAVSTNASLQSLNSRVADQETRQVSVKTENNMDESAYQGTDTMSNTSIRLVSGQSQALAAQEKNAQDPKSIAAADIQEYLMNTPSADMVMLDMTIVGDPELIKQDDAFSGENSNPEQLNGSVPMDSGEVYIEVVFYTPTDYNDSTGLMDLGSDTRTKKSKFSGYYRLVQVDNNLQNGQFTQKLTATRIFTDADYNSTSTLPGPVAPGNAYWKS
jgi:hypothetical protein